MFWEWAFAAESHPRLSRKHVSPAVSGQMDPHDRLRKLGEDTLNLVLTVDYFLVGSHFGSTSSLARIAMQPAEGPHPGLRRPLYRSRAGSGAHDTRPDGAGGIVRRKLDGPPERVQLETMFGRRRCTSCI